MKPNRYITTMDEVNALAEAEMRRYDKAVWIAFGLLLSLMLGLVFWREIAALLTPFRIGVLVGIVIGQFVLALGLALVMKPCGEPKP